MRYILVEAVKNKILLNNQIKKFKWRIKLTKTYTFHYRATKIRSEETNWWQLKEKEKH